MFAFIIFNVFAALGFYWLARMVRPLFPASSRRTPSLPSLRM